MLPVLFFLSMYFLKSHMYYEHTLFLKKQTETQIQISPHWPVLFLSPFPRGKEYQVTKTWYQSLYMHIAKQKLHGVFYMLTKVARFQNATPVGFMEPRNTMKTSQCLLWGARAPPHTGGPIHDLNWTMYLQTK